MLFLYHNVINPNKIAEKKMCGLVYYSQVFNKY